MAVKGRSPGPERAAKAFAAVMFVLAIAIAFVQCSAGYVSPGHVVSVDGAKICARGDTNGFVHCFSRADFRGTGPTPVALDCVSLHFDSEGSLKYATRCTK
jgi:hypothetical protein